MDIEVRELLLEDSSSPFAQWFDRLDSLAAAKVAVAIVRMQQGNFSSIKWFQGIGEFRID
jgi:putative component of toxin-antitoxin plasmid stabilization module